MPSLVPTHRRPKPYVQCARCNTVPQSDAGKALADGYMRRHRCKECSFTFFTLTAYTPGADGMHDIRTSVVPFLNRELSPWETEQRAKWWREEEDMAETGVCLPDDMLKLIAGTFGTPEAERTEKQKFIASAVDMLREKLEKM